MDGVKEMVENAIGEGFEAGTQNVYYNKATALYDAAVAAATAKAIERSGNPAVRSGSKSPNQDTVNRNLSRSPKADTAEQVAKTGKKVAKGVGVSITLGFIGIELATGDSPSEVLVPAAASAATAVAIAGAPVWATLFVTGSVAVGVGHLYQNYIPLEIRGKIDEGLNDMWDWGADRVDDATDWASNQWNRIFG
ncbi:hypothetical protein [Actinomyces ruminis]|uniref:hypothetical protein n=1 Tax=Actinomyces ruminis TaxID=1937003 RepID=UPI0011777036|nr:hypothetical protein [Actinomyces ruminis]